MTIAKVIAQLMEVKPHQYSTEALVGWLSDLDGRIWENYHRELLIPAPYEDLYIRYLAAQVDYYNAEFARYNNSMVMFNLLLTEYVNHLTRNYSRPQPKLKLF